jgi:hypothetical protein
MPVTEIADVSHVLTFVFLKWKFFSGSVKIMNFGVVNYYPKLTCPFSMLTYNVQRQFSYIYGIKIRYCF